MKKSKIIIGDEIVKCTDSLNRVSASNIYNYVNYPSENNAAFDGFAVKASDTKPNKNKEQIF